MDKLDFGSPVMQSVPHSLVDRGAWHAETQHDVVRRANAIDLDMYAELESPLAEQDLKIQVAEDDADKQRYFAHWCQANGVSFMTQHIRDIPS